MKKEKKAEGEKIEARPILIIRFPRALQFELFFMQMDALKRDEGLTREYITIFTKDAETDKVEFELLKVKFTGESIKELQHRILFLIDPEYKKRLEKMEYYKITEGIDDNEGTAR